MEGAARFNRAAPVLAVEVAGRDEGERELRQKAAWYFAHGVEVVWLLFPAERRVVVLSPGAEATHRPGSRLPGPSGPSRAGDPGHPALPGLAPAVDELYQAL